MSCSNVSDTQLEGNVRHPKELCSDERKAPKTASEIAQMKTENQDQLRGSKIELHRKEHRIRVGTE